MIGKILDKSEFHDCKGRGTIRAGELQTCNQIRGEDEQVQKNHYSRYPGFESILEDIAIPDTGDIWGTAGNDTLDGAFDFDTADYSTFIPLNGAGVKVDLTSFVGTA